MNDLQLKRGFVILSTGLFSLILNQPSLSFTIEPKIETHGQTLLVNCVPHQNAECISICNSSIQCEITESFCKSCAGTNQLKLKRIFDAIGTSLVAKETILSNQDLLKILVSGNFITLHSRTIFNYTSVYNGDQINAQFQAFCPGSSDSNGLLMIETDSETHQIGKILGAICTNKTTHFSEFRSIRINRFTYTP
jgi:hypothetical protein